MEYTYHRITIGFRPEDEELYQYVLSRLGGRDWGDKSILGREAFATLRLFGSLEAAQQAKKLLEAIKGYAAGDNWQDILFPGDDEPEIEDWLKNMFG